MSDDKRQRFAICGLGFISDKHIAAIEAIGGELVAGCDIDESKAHKIGEASFYTNWEEMLDEEEFDWLSICTPNYLHFPMMERAIAKGIKVICEKPLVLDYGEIERLNPDMVYPVMQLRYNQGLIDKQKEIAGIASADLRVKVHRDQWYFDSWKNDVKQAGGLLMNIGVHYIDLLQWFFGDYIQGQLMECEKGCERAILEFEKGVAGIEISINQPMDNQQRYLKIDDEEINLSKGFENLHTKVYEEAMKGKKISLDEVQKTIKIINDLYDR
jgi:UDP-N-acetyl-2-amino-2-deoxyglucuronate dehydrogenase